MEDIVVVETVAEVKIEVVEMDTVVEVKIEVVEEEAQVVEMDTVVEMETEVVEMDTVVEEEAQVVEEEAQAVELSGEAQAQLARTLAERHARTWEAQVAWFTSRQIVDYEGLGELEMEVAAETEVAETEVAETESVVETESVEETEARRCLSQSARHLKARRLELDIERHMARLQPDIPYESELEELDFRRVHVQENRMALDAARLALDESRLALESQAHLPE